MLGGVPLELIADAVGTPTYAYDAGTIRDRYATLEDALQGIPHRICYAVKANSNLAVLGVLQRLGAGADIVSGGELLRAMAVGIEPSAIVFSGVGKTDEELLAAMVAGVGHINVESVEELQRLAMLADTHDRQVRVGIRVNPDVTADTHPYIATGKGGLKFGVPRDQFGAALTVLEESSRLELGAIAMHLGSQITSPDPYVAGVDRLLELLQHARVRGHHPSVIDVGGGLGIRYRNENPLDPMQWVAALRSRIIESGCTLELEPGRYLVGPAGVLITKVLYIKHAGGRNVLVVDAGMNDLIRPSLYQAWHEIIPINLREGPTQVCDIVGPVCETGDFLALEREMPPLRSGDLLAVLGAGAYGFAMSSNYNSRARAAEVMVDDGKWAIARARERLPDLFRDECVHPFDQSS